MTTAITKIPHTEIVELIVPALNLEGAPGTIAPEDPLFGDGLSLGSIDALELVDGNRLCDLGHATQMVWFYRNLTAMASSKKVSILGS